MIQKDSGTCLWEKYCKKVVQKMHCIFCKVEHKGAPSWKTQLPPVRKKSFHNHIFLHNLLKKMLQKKHKMLLSYNVHKISFFSADTEKHGVISLPGYSSMFRRSYVQKVLCSEGSMFRRSFVQKVLCSEGSMFRRSYIQKVLCSEGPMFGNICS